MLNWNRAAAALLGATLLAAPLALAPRGWAQAAADPAPQLTDANLDQWLQYLLPKQQETEFKEVEWRSTLWEAAVEANRRDMPILLWAMNGHPLGCT